MLEQGDLIPVEVAGQSIGDAVVTEVTDDYIEVAFYGHPVKLSPNVLNYLDTRRQIEDWRL